MKQQEINKRRKRMNKLNEYCNMHSPKNNNLHLACTYSELIKRAICYLSKELIRISEYNKKEGLF